MEKLNVIKLFWIVTLLLGVMGPSFDGLAEEAKSPAQRVDRDADQQALTEGLQETLGMPVLKGSVWMKMTHDSKVAFIWGFGHVVSIEQHLMEKFPELKRDSFVAKVIEGMAGMPMERIVAHLDDFYGANQNQRETPVTNVIWDLMIKPNIKTGIAGRPLKK